MPQPSPSKQAFPFPVIARSESPSDAAISPLPRTRPRANGAAQHSAAPIENSLNVPRGTFTKIWTGSRTRMTRMGEDEHGSAVEMDRVFCKVCTGSCIGGVIGHRLSPIWDDKRGPISACRDMVLCKVCTGSCIAPRSAPGGTGCFISQCLLRPTSRRTLHANTHAHPRPHSVIPAWLRHPAGASPRAGYRTLRQDAGATLPVASVSAHLGVPSLALPRGTGILPELPPPPARRYAAAPRQKPSSPSGQGW
jgi:hypothetical protein